jgi:N-acylneuraminate cytidylyltransferase
MLVLSKERNPIVVVRCRKLQLPFVQGIDDKASFLRGHLEERGIEASRVAYLGDDVNDVECMRMVGLPVAVADAHAEARAAAALVLDRPGGRGAVREFCDLVLRREGAGRALQSL